jgi:hypothetical protein
MPVLGSQRILVMAARTTLFLRVNLFHAYLKFYGTDEVY